MYPVNFTEKMSVNLTHAHTVCTRPSLSQREGPGDEARVRDCKQVGTQSHENHTHHMHNIYTCVTSSFDRHALSIIL